MNIKKSLILIMLLLGLSACGKKVYINQPPQSIRQMINGCYVKIGCCSHHKGVCGNYNNKAVCCDGTMSKSCDCGE